MLDLHDIQSGVLRPRPTPYAATYIFLRIDDQKSGRILMGRAAEVVASATHRESPMADNTWVSVALTFDGLKALGVPQTSLDSFPPEFQEGMKARASIIGDTGENSPEHWDKPYGTKEIHVVVAGIAPDRDHLSLAVERSRKSFQDLPGVVIVGEQDCFAAPDEKEAFGFRDGISHPAVEGSGFPGSNPQETPLKAGEFVLGYPNESGFIAPFPLPEALGKNGTFVAIRKLHQRVGAFRKFLQKNSENSADEELLAAKMMGRWRSGAPLALSPTQDDPELGADPKRNNDFLFYEDDKLGLKTPPGSHCRRMNPRDAIKDSGTNTRIRRMIRRGTSYGPALPPGVVDDDGQDRGLMFVFVGASLVRQFEFVQSVWVNDGEFIGANTNQRDPFVGTGGSPEFIVPKRPIRKQMKGIPQFVVTRGGEYAFLPSISAFKWLADLE